MTPPSPRTINPTTPMTTTARKRSTPDQPEVIDLDEERPVVPLWVVEDLEAVRLELTDHQSEIERLQALIRQRQRELAFQDQISKAVADFKAGTKAVPKPAAHPPRIARVPSMYLPGIKLRRTEKAEAKRISEAQKVPEDKNKVNSDPKST